MKTLIELFDRNQMENVIAALRLQPEKIIFVGFRHVMTVEKRQALNRFFSLKGMKVQLAFYEVEQYDYFRIVNSLLSILEREEDCCFDLTGGKELVLAAMGAVSQLRNVPMVQFDISTDTMIPIAHGEHLSVVNRSGITIAQSIALYGGAVVQKGMPWSFDAEFCRDLELLWRFSETDSNAWNRQSMLFAGLERYASYHNPLEISAVHEWNGRPFPDAKVLRYLAENGLITLYHATGESLRFAYKNEQIRQCIIKAGTVLETYAFSLLQEISREMPTQLEDIAMGVYLDWDGVIHKKYGDVNDTINEVDLLAMGGVIPVFISCKHGEVRKDALYELNAVAEKFGGKYAKKILLATCISRDEYARRHILQRAEDMGISVVYNAHLLSREALKEKLIAKL